MIRFHGVVPSICIAVVAAAEDLAALPDDEYALLLTLAR